MQVVGKSWGKKCGRITHSPLCAHPPALCHAAGPVGAGGGPSVGLCSILDRGVCRGHPTLNDQRSVILRPGSVHD